MDGGGDAGNGTTGQNSGCGCRTAGAKEDSPASTFLGFGSIGLVGAARLRRRKNDRKN
jgi:MYXO-CTERM domain-containing protein